MVANVIEDHVITLVAPGEIFFGVIDHVIGADRSDKIDIPRAANSRDICAKSFGDLHGESSYASGGAVEQNVVPGLNLFLPQALQRRRSGQGRRGGGRERAGSRPAAG